MKRLIFFAIIFGLTFLSCSPEEEVEPQNVDLKINFTQLVDGAPVQLDQMIYQNALGQQFSIKTIKYFISQVKLYKADNSIIEIPDIHYVDIRTPETLDYTFSVQVPEGDYTGFSFVYGLIPEENITGSLGLDLDRLMEWPVAMGGGYHYAKIEGQFIAEENYFNFHSGALDGVDYSINVDFKNNPFSITNNLQVINLSMEMQNWFTNPTDWDFEYFGSGIMGNPEAQQVVHENGHDVFSFQLLERLE